MVTSSRKVYKICQAHLGIEMYKHINSKYGKVFPSSFSNKNLNLAKEKKICI